MTMSDMTSNSPRKCHPSSLQSTSGLLRTSSLIWLTLLFVGHKITLLIQCVGSATDTPSPDVSSVCEAVLIAATSLPTDV
jgi:hypothetical protein